MKHCFLSSGDNENKNLFQRPIRQKKIPNVVYIFDFFRGKILPLLASKKFKKTNFSLKKIFFFSENKYLVLWAGKNAKVMEMGMINFCGRN